MHPEFQKFLVEYAEECEAKGIKLDIGRMFYYGHDVVHSIPDSKGNARWRCVNCKHEWEGYDGFKCPECLTLRQAPRWECKHCQAEWFGKDGKFCPKCGKENDTTNF